MHKFEGSTLEDFIIDQCGMITPKLLSLLEPHRTFIENAICQYKEGKYDWQTYVEHIWLFLPEPNENHFRT